MDNVIPLSKPKKELSSSSLTVEFKMVLNYSDGTSEVINSNIQIQPKVDNANKAYLFEYLGPLSSNLKKYDFQIACVFQEKKYEAKN